MANRNLLLDFQHDGIDWMLMRSGLRRVTIEKTGWLACSGHAADDPTTLSALQGLCESLQTAGLTCLASIDGHSLLCRQIPVPFNDRRKVRQILPMELEATLPLTADELAMDFQMGGRDDAPAAIVVAMPNSHVEAYVHLLQKAGLDPALITFSGLPAAILLSIKADDETTSLLIDGDQHHALLFIIAQRRIQFVRNWRPPAVESVAIGLLKTACDQTVEAAAQVLPDDTTPSCIYLTPGIARFYPLESLSTDKCPATIMDVSASAGTTLDGALPADHGQGALALGLYEPLADKGLNLYRSTFPLKRFVQQYRQHFISTGILAAIFTVLFMVNIYLDISRNEKRAAFLESQTTEIFKNAFPDTRNVVDPLQQMIVRLRETKSHDFAASYGVQAAQIDILNVISTALPKALDIHVSQLVSGVERVQISGTTGTFDAVNQAKELLERTAFFGGVTIVSANMDQNAGRVQFKLALDLKKSHESKFGS